MRRPSLSEHLRLLKDAGLVTERRVGRQRLYSLRVEPLQDLADWLAPYERFWRDRLADLAELLEAETIEAENDGAENEGAGTMTDPRTTTDPTSIEVAQYLPHPPARVWRALTDAERLARWLMPNDFVPLIGHRFTFRTQPRPGFDGVVHCEVTLDSTVTWELISEGRGTRLLLRHEGFDPDDPYQKQALTIMGRGWRSHVWRALEADLDSPDS